MSSAYKISRGSGTGISDGMRLEQLSPSEMKGTSLKDIVDAKSYSVGAAFPSLIQSWVNTIYGCLHSKTPGGCGTTGKPMLTSDAII